MLKETCYREATLVPFQVWILPPIIIVVRSNRLPFLLVLVTVIPNIRSYLKIKIMNNNKRYTWLFYFKEGLIFHRLTNQIY